MLDYKYYKKFPDLVVEIMRYFVLDSNVMKKTVLSFCEKTGIKNEHGIDFVYDPRTVSNICDVLVDNNVMSCLLSDKALGEKAVYASSYDKATFERNIDFSVFYYNSIVYGFKYIYDYYKKITIPLVNVDNFEKQQIGSAFIIDNYIVTAKHCLEKAKEIEIYGFSAEELNQSVIYISKNDNVDVAIIKVDTSKYNVGYISNGDVLDDVIVMGYPSLPGFETFVTGEKATISAESKINLPTKGSITSYGNNILSKIELMLITAKIRGGNSGGPIINSKGYVVGITSQVPAFEGDYDDLGYGIAVPSCEIVKIINEHKNFNYKSDLFVSGKYLDIKKISI